MKLTHQISNDSEYNHAIVSIESIIQSATSIGGLTYLTDVEKEELISLSLIAEKYEDEILQIMPLRVN